MHRQTQSHPVGQYPAEPVAHRARTTLRNSSNPGRRDRTACPRRDSSSVDRPGTPQRGCLRCHGLGRPSVTHISISLWLRKRRAGADRTLKAYDSGAQGERRSRVTLGCRGQGFSVNSERVPQSPPVERLQRSCKRANLRPGVRSCRRDPRLRCATPSASLAVGVSGPQSVFGVGRGRGSGAGGRFEGSIGHSRLGSWASSIICARSRAMLSCSAATLCSSPTSASRS